MGTKSAIVKLMNLSYKKIQKGFTLIELLVVIGILAILAIAALVAINPAEAQKKARDTQRLKDMSTLQTLIESYLNDNPGQAAYTALAGAKDSSDGLKNCDQNWLGVDLCPYANLIPVDPSNRRTSVAINGANGVEQQAKDAYYYFNMTPSGYKICTYLESTSNAAKLKNDGGTYDNMFEVFSNKDVSCGTPASPG